MTTMAEFPRFSAVPPLRCSFLRAGCSAYKGQIHACVVWFYKYIKPSNACQQLPMMHCNRRMRDRTNGGKGGWGVFIKQAAQFLLGISPMFTPVDLPENSPVRARFYQKVAGMDVGEVNAIRSKLVFTDKRATGTAPAPDKEGSSYFGCWCFEAALVAYLWEIDDASYRGHLVYPKDLIDCALRHPPFSPSWPAPAPGFPAESGSSIKKLAPKGEQKTTWSFRWRRHANASMDDFLEKILRPFRTGRTEKFVF